MCFLLVWVFREVMACCCWQPPLTSQLHMVSCYLPGNPRWYFQPCTVRSQCCIMLTSGIPAPNIVGVHLLRTTLILPFLLVQMPQSSNLYCIVIVRDHSVKHSLVYNIHWCCTIPKKDIPNTIGSNLDKWPSQKSEHKPDTSADNAQLVKLANMQKIKGGGRKTNKQKSPLRTSNHPLYCITLLMHDIKN